MLKVTNYVETSAFISGVVGCALVIWQLVAGGIPPSVQMVFLTLAVLVFGIPHGAIDHLVAMETAKRLKKPFSLPIFLFHYVLTMSIYGLFWFIVPGFSLVLFLIISAWHFGETDLEKAPYNILWVLTRFFLGCFVLEWLLLIHDSETTPLLMRISQNNFWIMTSWQWFVSHSKSIIIFTLVLTILLFRFAHRQNPIIINIKQVFGLVLILALTFFLPLLPAFALYFGGWHAVSALKVIHKYITEQKKTIHKMVYWITWSRTIAFTALACGLLAVAMWFRQNYYQSLDPLPLFFVFLSLITLPHLNVMHHMNSHVNITDRAE